MQAKAQGFKGHDKQTGAYTYRWVISKVTGDGEQTSVEVIANVEDLQQKVELAYHGLDGRMFIQNQRYIEFRGLTDELPPDVRLKVQQCVDVAFGRASTQQLQDAAHHDKVDQEEKASAEGQQEA